MTTPLLFVIGTRAVDVKCERCDAVPGDACVGGRTHQERKTRAAQVTRDANRVFRAAARKARI